MIFSNMVLLTSRFNRNQAFLLYYNNKLKTIMNQTHPLLNKKKATKNKKTPEKMDDQKWFSNNSNLNPNASAFFNIDGNKENSNETSNALENVGKNGTIPADVVTHILSLIENIKSRLGPSVAFQKLAAKGYEENNSLISWFVRIIDFFIEKSGEYNLIVAWIKNDNELIGMHFDHQFELTEMNELQKQKSINFLFQKISNLIKTEYGIYEFLKNNSPEFYKMKFFYKYSQIYECLNKLDIERGNGIPRQFILLSQYSKIVDPNGYRNSHEYFTHVQKCVPEFLETFQVLDKEFNEMLVLYTCLINSNYFENFDQWIEMLQKYYNIKSSTKTDYAQLVLENTRYENKCLKLKKPKFQIFKYFVLMKKSLDLRDSKIDEFHSLKSFNTLTGELKSTDFNSNNISDGKINKLKTMKDQKDFISKLASVIQKADTYASKNEESDIKIGTTDTATKD